MKLTPAFALVLTHSIALVFSGAQGHNLRHEDAIVRDLAGDTPTVCGNTKCNKRATCVNGKCACKPGWTGPPYCRNLNECKELDPPPCKFAGAVCVDEDPHLDGSPGGKYHCACKTKEGWIDGPIFDEHGPLSCGDFEECSQDPSTCHPDATCTNLKPGFNCTCKDGFTGDGVVSCLPVIKPIDVQPSSTSKCGKKCLKNLSSSFCDEATGKCLCREGFFSPSGIGGACKGRNYCNEGLDNCAPEAKCIPLEGDVDAGFFSCECNKGYITATGFRQGTVCVPHNECADGSNNCNKATENCVDLAPPNTFKCVLITAPPTPSPTTAPPTPSPTPAPPTPMPTLPCTAAVGLCGTQATCNAGSGLCQCNVGFSGNPYRACRDKRLVTSNFISGTGNSNGEFTITRNQGIEVGLRGKLRYNANGQPENTFNYDGVKKYSFSATAYNGQPVWSFEWSVNTDYDGSTGLKVNALTYFLILDYDPAVTFNPNGNTVRVAFDPITPPSSGSPPDHSLGTSATLQSQGVEACTDTPSKPTTCVPPLTALQDYKNLIASNNLIQQSWRYGFFTSLVTPAPYAGFIPTTPGTFTIIFRALRGGVTVAETSIDIVTTV